MKVSKSKLKQKNILVIGDLILDQYLFGKVERISPEAPVPILSIFKTEERLGGAANVALNCKTLGCNVEIVSVIGNDLDGQKLVNKLEEKNIICFIEKNNSYKTVKKTRLIGNYQQILRMDDEQIPPKITKKTFNNFLKHFKKSDVIIFSDYAKGVLDELPDLIQRVKDNNKICLIDPKGSDIRKFKGADIITPNYKEIKMLVGPYDNEKDFERKIFKMMEENEIKNIVLTKGKDGITLFQLEENLQFNIKGRSSEVYDVTGAGDTVISVLAVLLSINYSLKSACEVANRAGGIIVQKFGTTSIMFEEIF